MWGEVKKGCPSLGAAAPFSEHCPLRSGLRLVLPRCLLPACESGLTCEDGSPAETSPEGRIQGQGAYWGNELRNHCSGRGDVRGRSWWHGGPWGLSPLAAPRRRPGVAESSLKGAAQWGVHPSSRCHWLQAAPWAAERPGTLCLPCTWAKCLLGLRRPWGSVCSREMLGCRMYRKQSEDPCYVTVFQGHSLRVRRGGDLADVT